MDQQRFETLTKAFSAATSRRQALGLLIAGFVSGLADSFLHRSATAQHIVRCESVADCLQRAADAFHQANTDCATEYRCRGTMRDGCYTSKIGCYVNAAAAYDADKDYCRSQGFADRGGCPEGWHCSDADVSPDFEGPVIDRMCCKDGQENCGASCVDTLNNDDACGACGNICPAGQSCANGECVGCAVDLDCNPERCEFCDPATRTCASRCEPAQCQTCEPATGACVPFECSDGETCDECGCLEPNFKRCPGNPDNPCHTCPKAQTCDDCGCLDQGYIRCTNFPGDACFTCPEQKTCDECGCLDPGYKRCPNNPRNPCHTCPESHTCDRCGCLAPGYQRCPSRPGNPCSTCSLRDTCDECGCLLPGYTRCSDCSQCPPDESCGSEGGCVR